MSDKTKKHGLKKGRIPGTFTPLPDFFISSGAYALDKVVWSSLWNWCGIGNGITARSLADIAYRAGCTKPGAKKAVERLIHMGLVRFYGNIGFHGVYCAIWNERGVKSVNGANSFDDFCEEKMEKRARLLIQSQKVFHNDIQAKLRSEVRKINGDRRRELQTQFAITTNRVYRETETPFAVTANFVDTQAQTEFTESINGVCDNHLMNDPREKQDSSAENDTDHENTPSTEFALPQTEFTESINGVCDNHQQSLQGGPYNTDLERCSGALKNIQRTTKNTKKILVSTESNRDMENKKSPASGSSGKTFEIPEFANPFSDDPTVPLGQEPPRAHYRDLLIKSLAWTEKVRADTQPDINACLRTINYDAVADAVDMDVAHVTNALKDYRHHLFTLLKTRPRAIPLPPRIGEAFVTWLNEQKRQAETPPPQAENGEASGEEANCAESEQEPSPKNPSSDFGLNIAGGGAAQTAKAEPEHVKLNPADYWLKPDTPLYSGYKIDHYSPIDLACGDIDLNRVGALPKYQDLNLIKLRNEFRDWCGVQLRKKPSLMFDHEQYGTLFMRYIDEAVKTEKRRERYLKDPKKRKHK